MTDEHLDIIGARYSKRRKGLESGWASAEGYAHKAASFDRMVAIYGTPVGARVLELGCGAGNTTLHVAERGFDAYGVDIAPQAIEWANENARRQNACARFSLCSGTDLRLFQDEFFDLVLDGHCLWMILGADRQACFTSVFRKLKPGGLFYALAHVVKEEYDKPYEIAPGAHFDPVQLTSTLRDVPMYQFSTEDGFRTEIEEAGFRILNCSPVENDVLDGRSKDEMPFVAGSIFVEARKPASKTAKKTVGG